MKIRIFERQSLYVSFLFWAVLLFLFCQPSFAKEFPVEVSGTLYKVWGDDEQLNPARLRYMLVDERGVSTDLDISKTTTRQLEWLFLHINKKVKVTGILDDQQVSPIKVEDISPVSSTDGVSTEAVATGAKPYITLLCKFRDKRKVTPHEVPYYQGMMGSDFPGLDHYWRENSYDQMNLTGSDVQGWYVMDGGEADFVDQSSGLVNLTGLLNDCATKADRDVFFPDFAGINLVFNGSTGCCAWGGIFGLTKDGVNRSYGVSWIPLFGEDIQHVFGHEMGHGLGLNHSQGPYGMTYDSGWDVMSKYPDFNHSDPTYGIVAVNTISMHKDYLGWVGGRKYIAQPDSSQTITLEQLALPVDDNAYLMAEIDKNGGSYYTVEARRFSGYDGLAGGTVEGIPLEGVIIHSIVPLITGGLSATVVDSNDDGNDDVNDDSAVWSPGETFEDLDNGITVSVDADTGTGYLVTVTRSSATLGDAVVSSLSGPAAASTGSSITVNHTVTNVGVGNLPPTSLKLYLSEDNIITISDIEIGNYNTAVGLASGESITADTVIEVPRAELVPPGTYFLGAIVDSANLIEESDETNNALAGNLIDISIGPDLIMTQLAGPGNGIAGGQITVTNTILNQGTGATPTGVYTGIYLSTDAVIDTSDMCILARFSTQLAPGESSTANSIITLSSSITPGMYYLGAIADRQCNSSNIIESDETNNVILGNQITIEGSGAIVDLVATSVSGPDRGRRGDDVTLSVRIDNAGNIVSGFFAAAIYLSTDATITTNDILIGTKSDISIVSGGAAFPLITGTIPASVARGDYYFGVIADYTDLIAESDESNNALAGNIINVK